MGFWSSGKKEVEKSEEKGAKKGDKFKGTETPPLTVEPLEREEQDVAKKSVKSKASQPKKQPSGKKVPVKSVWPGTLVVNNAPSGIRYVWGKIGATVDVFEQDLETLRSKNRRLRNCCGGGGETERIYFEIG